MFVASYIVSKLRFFALGSLSGFVLLVATLFAFPLVVKGDMTLVYTDEDGSIPFKVQVSGEWVRLDNNDGQTQSIVNLKDGTVQTILPQHRMVTRIDAGTSGRLAELQREARAAEREVLNLLPPEYGASIRASLAAARGIARQIAQSVSPSEVEIVATDADKEMAGTSCTVWETRMDGDVWTRSCMTEGENLELERADIDAMNAAFLYTQLLAQQTVEMTSGTKAAAVRTDRLDGLVALEMVQMSRWVQGTWTLTEYHTDPIPAETFAIPDGYTVNEL